MLSDLIHQSDVTTSMIAAWRTASGAAALAAGRGMAGVLVACPFVFGGTQFCPPILCSAGRPDSAHIAQCGALLWQLAALWPALPQRKHRSPLSADEGHWGRVCPSPMHLKQRMGRAASATTRTELHPTNSLPCASNALAAGIGQVTREEPVPP